jgi:hypothetical protein
MDPQSGIRTVIANSFYAKHNVDVLAIIETHRKQTKRTEEESIQKPTTMYNGRKFGQYPATIRHCDLCPPGPPVLCVRQFGSQWLCKQGSAHGVTPYTPRHRDYRNPIDMGYLDVDPPQSNPRSTMTFKELMVHDSFDNILFDIEDLTQEQEEQRKQEQVDVNLAKLPTSLRQLLVDLGFVPGVYEVTAQEMQKAWESATEVGYLDSLQLSYYANNSEKLKTVRMEALKLLHSYSLDLLTKQKRFKGNKINMYLLVHHMN